MDILAKLSSLLYRDQGIEYFTLVVRSYPEGKRPVTEHLRVTRSNYVALTKDTIEVLVKTSDTWGCRGQCLHRAIRIRNIQEVWYPEIRR
jgi:hypothetical protein